MTASELRRMGLTLYGLRWRSRLANVLARDIRTVRRWGSGESPIPQAVSEKIRDL